jgi:tocopherol O-methyltransferase
MIPCPTITKESIRQHYDLATPFYRLLWGPHIHHGLWEEGDATPRAAQHRLIDRLASAATLAPGERVLDVGCGMGGSSIELARTYGCTVTGITLSPLQRAWARFSAVCQGLGGRTRFLCQDAENVHFPDESFDAVWNIECSEHLFDKPAFFRKVGHWLRPGGRIALCAWLAGEGRDAEPHVRQVCESFLCPSLGTADDYRGWLRDAGLTERTFADLTPQVSRTWEICRQRVHQTGVHLLARLAGARMHSFIQHFSTLWEAYRCGAMRYGMFVAVK